MSAAAPALPAQAELLRPAKIVFMIIPSFQIDTLETTWRD